MVENRISGALCAPGKIPGLLLLFSGINSDMEDKRERKEIRGLSIKQEIKKKKFCLDLCLFLGMVTRYCFVLAYLILL